MKAFLARENLQWLSPAFFARYLELCTDGNGVFGAKMFWTEMETLERGLRQAYGDQTAPSGALLNRLFPNLRYVYLERQDIARQAVSLVIASQTKSWNTRNEVEGAPAYDFDAIYQVRSDLLKRAERWRAFFEENGIEPLRLAYEQVAADYEGALASVLDFLGIAIPAGFTFDQPEIGVQGTSLNREWAERFDAELEARGPFADPGAGSVSVSTQRIVVI